MTKYARDLLNAGTPDERRVVTPDEARKMLGALVGRIAAAMLERHGYYGFTDEATGHRVLLVRK